MSDPIAWSKGGTAVVVEIDGERLVVSSTTSSPPGSRPEGVLLAAGTRMPVRMKVHVCKKNAEGRFVIEGRLLDAARTLRDALRDSMVQG